jgi:hypothetical protein
MSLTISVQLDAVQALAAELTALAADLDDDAALCGSTAGSLAAALGGEEGWTAADAGSAWAGMMGVLAARARAVAGTLAAAVDSYRAADLVLAERIGSRRPHAVAVAW